MLFSYLTFAISSCFLNITLVYCGSGFISESISDSKFFCETSSMKLFKTYNELQCVHKCAMLENCEVLNYREGNDDGKNCEVFQLLRNHRSCRMRKDDAKWKALVYQARCNFRNYCYPCTCNGDCSHNDAYCQCSLGLVLPIILISFEEATNDAEVRYTRGSDAYKKSSVSLVNGTKVGSSVGRIGNVLQLDGIDPGAIAGDFHGTPINNPQNKLFTVGLWIKVLSPQPQKQTIFGSGRVDRDTGILLQVAESATKIEAWLVTTREYLSLAYDVKNALTLWTHIAFVADKQTPQLKLFINGKLAARTTTETPDIRTNAQLFTSLVFGAVDALFPLKQQDFNIHIDDFAIWLGDMSDQIPHIMDQNFISCRDVAL